MSEMLMRIKTVPGMARSDDEFVAECMRLLQNKWPQIDGWTYERVDEDTINLLIWGDEFNVQ